MQYLLLPWLKKRFAKASTMWGAPGMNQTSREVSFSPSSFIFCSAILCFMSFVDVTIWSVSCVTRFASNPVVGKSVRDDRTSKGFGTYRFQISGKLFVSFSILYF